MITNLLSVLGIAFCLGVVATTGYQNHDDQPHNAISNGYAFSTSWKCDVLCDFNFQMTKTQSCNAYYMSFRTAVTSFDGPSSLVGPVQFQSQADIRNIDDCNEIIDDFYNDVQIAENPNEHLLVISQFNATDNCTYTRVFVPYSVQLNDVDQTWLPVDATEFCSSFTKPNGVYVLHDYYQYNIKSTSNASSLSSDGTKQSNWYMAYTPQQFHSLDDYEISSFSGFQHPGRIWSGFEHYLFVLDNSTYTNSQGHTVSMNSAPLRIRNLHVINTLDEDTWYQYGWNNGYVEGKEYGYSTGYQEGNTNGYNTGSQEGYANGKADGRQEVIDTYGDNFSFGNLFGSIADTPIRVLYGLFNFDLFGTSMLVVVLSCITAIVVFNIVKHFIK